MTVFSAKMTTKKGIRGEDLCFKYLSDRGHTVYRPDCEDKRHPIDALIMHGEKYTICAADVKTKPKRYAYPDTGINFAHYGEYCYIKNVNNIRVFLFFVDEDEKRIYGNWLDILEQRREVKHNGDTLIYPLRNKGQIYFPISAMVHIADIPDESVIELRAMRNTRFTGTFDASQSLMDFDYREAA